MSSTIELSGNEYFNTNNVPVQSFSGTLVGLSVKGDFSITTVDNINFLEENALGQVRNMVIKLLETDRGTGAFTQLSHEAHLEVECDFRKFIIHNRSSSSQDDSYQLTGITLTNTVDANVGITTEKVVNSSKFTFDIDSSLEAGVGAPVNKYDLNSVNSEYKATYDISDNILTSNWFPSGAVIIDLKSHPTMADVSNNMKVTVTSTSTNDLETYDNYATPAAVLGAPSAHNQYQINVSTGNIGMTLYSKLSIKNCATQPNLFIDSTFQPDDSAAIIGSNMNLGNEKVTIHLLETDVEDFTKAQIITLGVLDSEGNEVNNQANKLATLEVSLPNPSAIEADDFSVSIGLDELSGSLGTSMISGLETSIGIINNSSNLLLKAFTISVEPIPFETESDFSGFMRTLYAGDINNRDASMPIKEGEKLIIETPSSISLAVQPFIYAGFSTDNTLNANQCNFNLINNMSVYGVLKHKLDVIGDSTNTPIMQTTTGFPLL